MDIKLNEKYRILDKFKFYISHKYDLTDNMLVNQITLLGGNIIFIEPNLDNLVDIIKTNETLGNIYYIGCGDINELMVSQYVKTIVPNNSNFPLKQSAHYASMHDLSKRYETDALNLIITDITSYYIMDEDKLILGQSSPLTFTKYISLLKLSGLKVNDPSSYDFISSLDDTIVEIDTVTRVEFCAQLNADVADYKIGNALYPPATKMVLGDLYEQPKMKSKIQTIT